METVFDAGNNIEAHMIVNLLERSGIDARIMGEHLQGAVGELPAHGNIRVVVDPADVQEARKIINEWERRQVSFEPEETSVNRSYIGTSIFPFFLGALVASAILYWFFYTPFYTVTTDHNRDGKADEWLYWQGEFLHQVETDRNHDGKVDCTFSYSRRNGLEKSKCDNDFDGTPEETSTYKYNQLHILETNLGGNGQPSFRYQYKDGVLIKVDMFVPRTRTIRKSQTYKFGSTLTEAHWDSNNDGVLDTLIKYGPYEEELSRSPVSVGTQSKQ